MPYIGGLWGWNGRCEWAIESLIKEYARIYLLNLDVEGVEFGFIEKIQIGDYEHRKYACKIYEWFLAM